MSERPFSINGQQFVAIADSDFFKPDYGLKPFSEDAFFARHVGTGCLAVISDDHFSFQLLPECIASIEDAHQIFAFAALWYQRGKFHGADEQKSNIRRALGV